MRVFLVLILFVAANIQAQVLDPATPFSGMAGADNALFSPWCVFSNQAGISRLTHSFAGISYRQVFDLKELATKALFAAVPTQWGVPGITYIHWGYEKYNEQLIGLAYGKRLGRCWDVGIKMDYLFSKVAKQSGNRQTAFCEIGVIGSLPSGLSFGIHVYNPGKMASLSGAEHLYIPEVYSASLAWKIDTMFLLATQLDYKEGAYYSSVGILFSYESFIQVRCGFKTKYNCVYTGLGMTWNRIELTVNYNTQANLGNTMSVCTSVYF